MTLFRKVFQNQARPATGEETMDDEALRDAFNAMVEGRDTVRRDPFGVDDAPDAPEVPPGLSDDMFDSAPAEDPVAAPDTELRLRKSVTQEVAETEPDIQDVSEAAAPATPDTNPETPDEDAPRDTWETSEDQTEAHTDHDASDAAAPQDMDLTMAGITAALSRAEAREPEAPDAPSAPSAMDAMDAMDAEAEVAPTEPAAADPVAAAPDMAPNAASDALDLEAFMVEQQTAPAAVETPVRAPADPPQDMAPALDLSAPLDPAPTAGRAGRRAGRVKTRLLGFNRDAEDNNNPFEEVSGATAQRQDQKFPVGWLVVVEGPGTGHAFSLFNGASVIGRGEDQVIKLDFGDNSISRQNHAAIAYDEEENKFYIGHGGKSNIIRRNGRPVLTTEELQQSDLIRIGETTLRFVALCGSDFKWEVGQDDASTAV